MANKSDYNKTERTVKNNQVQYAPGGSRLTGLPDHFHASRVGKVKPEELYGNNVPVVVSDGNKEQYYKGAGDNPDEGIDIGETQKLAIRQWNKDKTAYWHMGKWRSANAPVEIGDFVVITDEGSQHHGTTAVIMNVRRESDWTVSVIMREGKFRGMKYVFNQDQYAIKKKKGVITKDDYLLDNLARSKKIVETDGNIE